ncbi:MAG: hypothetical protein AABZ45_02385 [Pseudomonadota bacterium]
MTVRLIKAQTASGMEIVQPLLRSVNMHQPDATMPPELTIAERELLQLRTQIMELEAKLKEAERRWSIGYQSQLADATALLAQQYRDDDEKRIAILLSAVTTAYEQTQRQIVGALGDAASRLAIHALSRLASIRVNDADWLADMIAQRLSMLNGSMVVALQLPPDMITSATIIDALAERLPDGCRVVADATVARGTARILLRLGQIDIDPAQGIAALIEAIIPALEADND